MEINTGRLQNSRIFLTPADCLDLLQTFLCLMLFAFSSRLLILSSELFFENRAIK